MTDELSPQQDPLDPSESSNDSDDPGTELVADIESRLQTQFPDLERRPEVIREFSYERGCQAKKPLLLPRKGKLFGLHPARCWRLGVTRPVAVMSRRFHVSDGGSTPSAREAAQAEVLAPDNVPTMILCETRGL